MEKKLEVVYYEMINMEKRLTEKTEVIFRAREEINTALGRFEILQKELIQKMEDFKINKI